jgi:nicotinate (nicotinamide) nucleotide adenylyltransferase
MAARKAKKAKVEEAPITPLKLPRGVKTLVVYGGSFDPPHAFHLNVWYPIAQVFGPECSVLYVPAARSPFKASGPVASDEHRIAMLLKGGQRIALNELGGLCGVWTDEIDRARWHRERSEKTTPSYSIETIRRLRQIIPKDTTLRLLIGSDQVLAFHMWRDWQALMREAEPLVVLREPAPTPKDLIGQLDGKVWSLREKLKWASRIVPSNIDRRSSTSIRTGLPSQPLVLRDWSLVDHGLKPEVAKYIIKHRLYGVGTKWKPIQAPPRSAKGDRAAQRKK